MLVRHILIYILLPSFVLAQICLRTDYKKVNGETITLRLKYCCIGYKRLTGNILRCVPQCRQNCGSGICLKPNTCRCNRGYENINHLPSNRCVPQCKGGCTNGRCVSPDRCICANGYEIDVATGHCLQSAAAAVPMATANHQETASAP